MRRIFAEPASAVVTIEAGSQRRPQAGFKYQSEDSPGGKPGDQATLQVPVRRSQGGPLNFDFAFADKGR
ncbi:MAG TPA: hypothetical protein VGO91_13770 [Pyrinomonadaceae bacterium]|jgi:hypothetical protein|nr:hypothetical protein [Pyrinomonadaceae bacterium]